MMDLSFPIKKRLSEESFAALIAAASLVNKNKFTEGVAALTTLRDSLAEEDFIGRSIVSHRVNSANYLRGEYLQAYKGSQDLMEIIAKKYEAVKENEDESLLQIKEVEYVLLKEQVFVAKCLNKLKDYTKAEDVCDDIIELIKGKEVITKYHKFALKAHYMRAKNQLNLMEFRKSERILDDEAKPILKKLIEKYYIYAEGQEKDEAKDLADNRYSFEFRKRFALYLKKFAFYD